MKLILI